MLLKKLPSTPQLLIIFAMILEVGMLSAIAVHVLQTLGFKKMNKPPIDQDAYSDRFEKFYNKYVKWYSLFLPMGLFISWWKQLNILSGILLVVFLIILLLHITLI